MEGSLRGERQGGGVEGGRCGGLHLCVSGSGEGVGREEMGMFLPSGIGTCWLHRQESEKETKRKWLKDALQ